MKLRLALTALLALSLNGCMTQEMWEEDKKVEKSLFIRLLPTKYILSVSSTKTMTNLKKAASS